MGMAAGGSDSMNEINITPLVDVMLVLLIIFMVASPMMEKQKRLEKLKENIDDQQRIIELNLPVADKSDPTPVTPQDNSRVQLRITPSKGLMIGDVPLAGCEKLNFAERASWQPCMDLLQAKIAATPAAFDVGVTIDAEPLIPFGIIVGSIHHLRKAGVAKVGMMPHE